MQPDHLYDLLCGPDGTLRVNGLAYGCVDYRSLFGAPDFSLFPLDDDLRLLVQVLHQVTDHLHLHTEVICYFLPGHALGHGKLDNLDPGLGTQFLKSASFGMWVGQVSLSGEVVLRHLVGD